MPKDQPTKGNGNKHRGGDPEFGKIKEAFEEWRNSPGFHHNAWEDPIPQFPRPGETALGIFYDPNRYKPKQKNNK